MMLYLPPQCTAEIRKASPCPLRDCPRAAVEDAQDTVFLQPLREGSGGGVVRGRERLLADIHGNGVDPRALEVPREAVLVSLVVRHAVVPDEGVGLDPVLPGEGSSCVKSWPQGTNSR